MRRLSTQAILEGAYRFAEEKRAQGWKREDFLAALDNFLNPIIVNNKPFERFTWTGGDTPPKRFRDPDFLALRRFFWREQLAEAGPLDLWACAGTTPLERARMFWNSATLTAWRTFTNREKPHGTPGS